eukprot:310515_1
MLPDSLSFDTIVDDNEYDYNDDDDENNRTYSSPYQSNRSNCDEDYIMNDNNRNHYVNDNHQNNIITKLLSSPKIIGIFYFVSCFIIKKDLFVNLIRSILIILASKSNASITSIELYECLQQKQNVQQKMVINISIAYWLYELIKFVFLKKESIAQNNKFKKLLLILFGLFYVLIMFFMNKGGKFWSHLSFWNEIPTLFLCISLLQRKHKGKNLFFKLFMILFVYVRCVKVTRLVIIFSKQLYIAQNEGRINDDINGYLKWMFICGLPISLSMGYWLSYKLVSDQILAITKK